MERWYWTYSKSAWVIVNDFIILVCMRRRCKSAHKKHNHPHRLEKRHYQPNHPIRMITSVRKEVITVEKSIRNITYTECCVKDDLVRPEILRKVAWASRREASVRLPPRGIWCDVVAPRKNTMRYPGITSSPEPDVYTITLCSLHDIPSSPILIEAFAVWVGIPWGRATALIPIVSSTTVSWYNWTIYSVSQGNAE